MQPFPLYRAAGSHRELGRQHGEQAREKVVAHVDYIGATMKLSRAQLRERALLHRLLFAEHAPHLLEEIVGLAEGADIDLADALAANIRGALQQLPGLGASAGGCTSFAVSGRGTAGGRVLAGQNSDMLPAASEFSYILNLQPEGKPEVMMYTFGGMIGYHGLNSAGVAHFANDLGGGGPVPRFGLSHYPLKRLMLECQTMAQVLKLFDRLPLWANGNYVVADGSGAILDVEATADGPFPLADDGSGFIAHANHYVCAEHDTPENRALCAPDSYLRHQRMAELIGARFGQITVDDCKAFLRDRDNDPSGICRQAQTGDPAADWQTAGITVASIIADPAAGELHVAAGNAADAPFECYRLAGG